MISVLRDDDGAQQNALAMTLPASATSAKHVQRPRYAREKTIASKYAGLKRIGQSTCGIDKTFAEAVSGKSQLPPLLHLRDHRASAPRRELGAG